MRHAHTCATALALALLLPLLSGCLGDEPTVALLIPAASSASRTIDVGVFEERVRTTCAECVVTVYDAGDDATQQKSQVRQALAESADILVVAPVEPEEMESLTGGEVPLVSLGTLVPGADSHVGLEGPSESETGGESETGSDSDLEAARDLVLGRRRTMTYVPIVEMSERAADVTVGLLADEPVADGEEVEGVRSWLYASTTITLDNLATVLVGGGVLTLDDLCEGATAKRCEQIGLR